MTPAPGEALPDVAGLDVLDRIGHGASSDVYRVRRGGRQYALKILSIAGSEDPSLVAAFYRETALLACLHHPGLPQVREAGVAGDRPYLLMDLVAGHRLTEVLARGPLAQDRIVALGICLAEALDAAHDMGLVHRDVKPDNIVLADGGTAHLVDFGLAARVADGGTSDVVAGTLAYCAPEQTGMLCRPVDRRTDLYALGVVLFECATGTAPFVTADVGELIRMHAVAPAPDACHLRPDLAPTLAAVIDRLLAKDPDDRYQTASGLCADLRRWADGPGVPDFPIGQADAPVLEIRDRTLIGRQAEVDTLTAAWEGVRSGNGAGALIVGPSGVGKSRVARELVTQLARQGRPVLVGRSVPDGTLPLAPLRAAIDGYLQSLRRVPQVRQQTEVGWLVEAAAPAAGVLAGLSAELAVRLGAGTPATEVTQEQFTAAVAAFLCEFARLAGGVVLYLDDVQWLDDVTCAVLRQLRPVLPGAPLWVLATARDAPRDRGIALSFQTALDGALKATVALGSLDRQDVIAFLATMTGGMSVDGEIADRFIACTDGTPAALLDYFRDIVDAGLMRPHWGAWRVDSAGLARLNLPGGMADLVCERVAALDPESRRLLGAGAVLGSRFSPGTVAAVCDVDRQRVQQVASAATGRHLVEDCGNGEWAFVHEQVRDALLGQFEELPLRALCDRIADVLDSQGNADPATVYLVAFFRLRGDTRRDPDQLFRSCIAAARQALADHAYAQAVSFLEAVAVEESTDTGLLTLLATAYRRAGRLEDSVRTLRLGLESTSDQLERARLLYMIASVHDSVWDTRRQCAAVEQALAELGCPLPGNQLFLALTTLWMLVVGWVVGWSGIGCDTARGAKRERYRALIALYDVYTRHYVRDLCMHKTLLIGPRAVYLANRVGVSAETARARGDWVLIAHSMGLRRMANRLDAQARRTAAELGDQAVVAYLAWTRAVGIFGSGGDSGESTRQVMREHGSWLELGQHLDCYHMLAWDLLLRGDTAEAEDWFRRRRLLVEASGQTGRTALRPFEAALPALRGQAVEAAAYLRDLGGDGDPPVVERLDVLIATMHLALEQCDVGAAFDTAAEEFEGLGLVPHGILPALHSVYAYLAYGRVEQCRQAPAGSQGARLAAARRAVASLKRVSRRPILAAHHRVLTAALCEVRGEPRAALEALTRAEPVLYAVDAPLVAFEAARVRARALRALGVRGESGRHAEVAARIAQSQGWIHRIRWVDAEFGTEVSAGTRSRTGLDDVVTMSVLRRRLEALEQVSLAASRVLDLDQLSRIALDEMIRILGAERAILFLVDGESQLSAHMGRDGGDADLDVLTGYSMTLVERVRQERVALVVAGTEQGEVLGSRSVLVHGLRSIIIAPLCFDDRLLGLVYLDSRLAKGIFTVDDIDILTAMANQVAVAMETARAAQLEMAVVAARQQRDVAEMLRVAMSALSDTLNPDAVLERLLDAAVRAVNGVHGWLLTLATSGGDPRFGRLRDIDGPLVDPTGEDWVALFAQPGGRLRSGLAVPLSGHGQLVGVLVLADERPGAYDAAHVETIGALAAQGMIAYENARLFRQVRHLAAIDSLTQLANRRGFLEAAEREFRAVEVTGRPLTVVMIDIDHFKRINDTYGHQVGDEVIRAVAQTLRLGSRRTDLVGRYGGEEFVVVLPDGVEEAAITAERLREQVENGVIETAAGPVTVTISAGVVCREPVDPDFGSLLARADECLYSAKRAGRNRVVARVGGTYPD